MSDVIVGVDAGASRVRVRVTCDGVLVGHGEGPGINPNVIGPSSAIEAILAVVRAHVQDLTVAAICIGAAGIDRDSTLEHYEAAVRRELAPLHLSVVPDALLPLRAAVPVGDGAVLVAGTGSIAFAIAGTQTFRTGGYGHAFGDEGSGFVIGRQGVRLALQALDLRAPQDELTRAICEHFGTTELRGLLASIYEDHAPNRRLALVAPLVIRLASEGHRGATKIVQQAALDLADLIRSVARNARLSESDVPLVFAGGLLRENSLLTFLLETRVTNELPLMRPVKHGPEPVEGALAIAESLLLA